MPRCFSLFLLFCLSLNSFAQEFGAPQSNPAPPNFLEAAPAPPVTVTLVADVSAMQPGKPFRLGVKIQHGAGWHSYWKNSGSIEQGPKITWELPAGAKAGELQWPAPEVLKVPLEPGKPETKTSYAYGHDYILWSEVTPSADLAAGSSAVFKAKAVIQVCKEQCIQKTVNLELTLPVAAEAAPDAREQALFQAPVPAVPDAWEISASETQNVVTLKLTPKAGANAPLKDVTFLSANPDLNAQAPQTFEKEGESVLLGIPVITGEEAPTRSAHATGLLLSPQGFGPDGKPAAIAVDVPLKSEAATSNGEVAPGASTPAGNLPSVPAPPAGFGGTALIYALGFLGGLILNIMPCVFPVIGLKILGFVRQAGQDKRKIVMHGLVFTAGVLLSFLALTTVILLVRRAGGTLTWGAQLSYPWVVFLMMVVTLVFGLSLAGLFEIGTSATAAGGDLTRKKGYAGSFFSGLFATLISTPCSAPLLGAALSYMFTLPPVQSVLYSQVIGLGLATPYLLLSLFPQLASKLPRPGAWMESFKQFMAFPLFATTAWLVYVIADQVGDAGVYGASGLLKVMLGLTVVAMGCWIYGRWSAPERPEKTQRLALVLGVLVLAGGMWLGWPNQVSATDKTAVNWQKWTPELQAKLIAEGKPVYVDFTAKWCQTCLTNKRVYEGQAVKDVLQKKGVVLLKADKTADNPVVDNELKRLGKEAIPVNALYLPGQAEPHILPEFLTEANVLEALGKF